jgi:hypothetical protein
MCDGNSNWRKNITFYEFFHEQGVRPILLATEREK